MPTRRSSVSTSTAVPSSKRHHHDWMIIVTYSCVVLAALLACARVVLLLGQDDHLIQTATYQAVALDNGQTFFGKLVKQGPDVYVLIDVYYLRNTDTTSTADGATTDTTTPGLELVALTADVHKPYNHLVLNPKHIIYWQNLQASSPILDAIAQDHATAKDKAE